MSKMKQMHSLITELENILSQGHNIISEVKKLLSTEVEVSEPEQVPDSSKEIKLEDLRAVLATKAREGYKDEVRALLNAHGASSLSTLDKKHYAEVLEEAGGIGND